MITPEQLCEIEEIKTLKYRYIRAVDQRDWDLLASTLTEDVTTSYSSGRWSLHGRDAVISFLQRSLPAGESISTHQVHQPEIELTGATTAKAVWSFSDVVIKRTDNVAVHGAGYYEDELVKLDGEWRISHTGYRRIYSEIGPRDKVTLTEHWWSESESAGELGS